MQLRPLFYFILEFRSRSLDGQTEYKTMYEADENGYRAKGDHLPVIPAVVGATVTVRGDAGTVIPAVVGVRSLDVTPGYVFNYEAPGSHSHYQMGQPGKAVQGSFTFVTKNIARYFPDGTVQYNY